MTDLRTQYMGLELDCPLVASSSPLTRDVDSIRHLEEQGAGAIVLPSLFEEQLMMVSDGGRAAWRALVDPHGELEPGEFAMSPASYLELVGRAKTAVSIPVIASLNVAARGRWIEYSQAVEQAGADALELDLYKVPADPSLDSLWIESVYADIVHDIKSCVSIPVAVKLSPYFTAIAAVAQRLDQAGANALVLFNRFYQPTIDVDSRQIVPSLELSTSAEGRLPMVWIALLKGQVQADLGATTGVHTGVDAVRMIMAGADVAMVCSALLRDGVERMGGIRRELEEWLDCRGQATVEDIRGLMSRCRLEGTDELARSGYTKVLTRYW